ncbi:hypothetical protein [Vallicoccus soli]|uniref:WD40 repeat domain-containing protein n=1 Tax=Vallicoccus soli TaxID=2339232 RepID=A0A3A3Z0N6_9ACTN|nr:hypothetical protein [Vallicoccus soli]RJK97809.1 hypothetical protein D5H78_02145 [Vallicoccus soli]
MAAGVLAVLPSAAAAAAAASPDVVLRIEDPGITESSGLAVGVRHPDVLWTVDDSGGGPVVHGVGRDGSTVAELELEGVEPRDWEALAPARTPDGRPALLVGDIGDNSASRDRGILLHLVEEPRDLGRTSAPVVASYRLRYPDGPRDAEGLAVDPRDGRVLVVSKELLGGGVYAAAAPDPDGPTVLERVADAPSLVTDAAFLPDGRLVLRGYQGARVLGPDLATLGSFDLPSQPQGETLAVDGDGTLLIGSEGERSEVLRVRLPEELAAAAAGPSPSASPPPGDDGPDEELPWPGGGEPSRLVLLALTAGAVGALVLRVRALRRRR